MDTFGMIRGYQDAKRVAELELRSHICKVLKATGFGDVEEASVAFVRGHDVVFTAYVCQDEVTDVLQAADITLGGDISIDSIVIHV